MKKELISAVMALAFAMPCAAWADDLTLPGGTVWPLGKEISVHAGSDSYFAPKLEKALAEPKLAKDLSKNLMQIGVYGKKEKKAAETFAKELVEILKDARVYQLSAARGTDLFVAWVISGTAPDDFFTNEKDRWETWANTMAEKLAETEDGKAAAETVAKNKEAFASMKDLVRKTEGVTASGTAYETGSLYGAPELDGYTVPFFTYWLRTKQDGTDTLTVIFTDQASGSFFEPFLEKGAGELK